MSGEAEAATRANRIDPKLASAGWRVVRLAAGEDWPSKVRSAIAEFPTDVGPADYALCDGGDVLAIAEAKKLATGADGILPQAERYSRVIETGQSYQDEFGVPFLYSTSGEKTWFRDVRHPLNRSREVATFHTAEAMREMLERDLDADLGRLQTIPKRQGIRDYQLEANVAIETAIAERKRKMLIAMATGTGKTLMAVNEIYRLMKSGVARRVLFLVDRRALASQTVRAFASFEAEPGLKFDKIYPVYSQRFQQGDFDPNERFDPNVMPNSLLTAPKLGDAFVYVCTVQRMAINLFGEEAAIKGADGDDRDDDADKLPIPIHAFDLIVADECHRGYTARELSVWRNTLEWFDAIKIGLTATPAAHTMAYFEHMPFRYDYERAVREGWLCDYNAVRIKSDVRMNGVFLREGEQVDEVDPVSGATQLDLLEDERTFDATQVERAISAPDSNRKILQEIKRYAEAHQAETGRFPKTLIFAVNDLPHVSHAQQLVDLARDIFGQGEAFAAKITGRVDRPLQQIRMFRNRPNPKIVVTVDLLSTGVDIPDIEFIVFLRPVKSRILFEQMLGRGTRLTLDLVPPKTHFTVFDCFDGTLFEYFRSSTGMTVEPPEGDTKTLEQIVEDIWQNHDRDSNVRRLVKRLRRIDKNMSGDARDLFAPFIPYGDVGAFAERLPPALQTNFGATMVTLRDPAFIQLCLDYPRAKSRFIKAPGVIDTVESGWLIRGATGQEYKPEDYLQHFARFVTEHIGEVEALNILLSRPASWNPEVLTELQHSLAQAPEHFTVPNLQRAFQVTHHKALADIISMVKRAARTDSALFTAEERVERAIERVVADRVLTEDQQAWLGRIRQHLVANLSIDRNDFDVIPVLLDRGGWGRANRAFEGTLTDLIADLNRELVAA